MNQQYDNTNRGALWKNDKQGIETRADYRGQANIDGVDYWVDMWRNTSKEGKPFLSLRFRSKAAANAQGGVRPTTPTNVPRSVPRTEDDFNDDIPF